MGLTFRLVQDPACVKVRLDWSEALPATAPPCASPLPLWPTARQLDVTWHEVLPVAVRMYDT